MPLPVLTTERLTIRPATPDDAPAWQSLMAGAFQSDATLEETRETLIWASANYRELARMHQPPYGDYAVMLNETGELIGSVGIVPSAIPWGVFEHGLEESRRNLLTPEFGLFWAVHPDHWGKGYAGEAAQPVINFMFNEFDAKRMVATTEFTNLASQRVMEKLGMRLMKNPYPHPFWFQVVGIVDHP
jgi:[ribosomal protein S5]-alanine N-acetyltransferase